MTKLSPDFASLHAHHSDARDIMQQTMKFFSIVLGMSAFGLWVVPGATEDGAEALVRLVVSFLFLGIAVGLWGAGRPDFDEEFHLDIVNHQLTHILRGHDGIARTQGQYGLDALDIDNGVLEARNAGGRGTLRLSVGDHLDARTSELLAGMRKRTLTQM
ncbi:MAG: hypothetical protein ACRBBS_13300 [Thalassovita sp.]